MESVKNNVFFFLLSTKTLNMNRVNVLFGLLSITFLVIVASLLYYTSYSYEQTSTHLLQSRTLMNINGSTSITSLFYYIDAF
jgi:high-affinity K+ transport system ATPase subunit B